MSLMNQTPKRKCKEILSPQNQNKVTMDPNDLITLIRDTINSNLDEKLKSLPTKADLEEIKNEITAVNSEVQSLKLENSQLKEELSKVKNENESNKRNIQWLQNQVATNKLFIKGLASASKPEEEVKKLFSENLGVAPSFKTVRKIFDRNGKMAVIVELENQDAIQEVFKSTRKLVNTSISIERDMMPMKQDHKKAFLRLKIELLAISKDYKIMIRADKMKIQDQWFRWSNGNILLCGNGNGVEQLAKLYGEAIRNININYDDLKTYTNPKN